MNSTEDLDERIKQGRRSLRSGDPQAAAEIFRELVERHPDDVPAHEGLGIACFHAADYQGAIDAFQQTTRLEPKSARGYINLGAVYNRKGDFHSALDALRKALQRDRSSGDAFYNMGMAHKGLNQLSLAVSAYREALRHSPEMAEAHLNLANVYREMKNLRQAETHYRKALELRPDFERAQRGLQQTRELIDDESKAVNPMGRLVENAATAAAVSSTRRRRLTQDDREQIYRAAYESGVAARTIARHLGSDFEKKLLSLSGVVTRNPDQKLMFLDAHDKFRESLGTLIPLFQQLTDRVEQLSDAVGRQNDR